MLQAEPTNPGLFAATRWTLILAARQSGTAPSGAAALEELCRIYWKPLYAFVRCQGSGHEDAQDLTQEFFARLLSQESLITVDRAKGRFRSFLLASLKHFLANERDKARTLKRGGGQPAIPLDALSDIERQRLTPAIDASPEQAFERQWAMTVLEQVLAHLRADYTSSGKEPLFDTLKPFLTADGSAESHAETGRRCGLSEGAVKVSIHRLRRRYRELLRDEIAQTVATPAEIDEEIRALFMALR